LLQVLSEEERAQVHERTLNILAKTGLRVDTAWGRQILKDAGAEVDESTNIVRFPRRWSRRRCALRPRSSLSERAGRAGICT
jgi:trimethylamine:corrinoid methyltransferase-like protein